MPTELVWFILPIAAILWAAGGTWNKNIRRFGIPTLFVLACVIWLSWAWWQIGLWVGYWLVTILPFTLIGSDIHDNWFNWVWIWIWSALMEVPAVLIGYFTNQLELSLWLILVPTIISGTFATLSNIQATKNYFPWKLCEIMFGTAIAIPPAMLIYHP